ncbi:MAG TPA: acyl-CoA dehydrogenase family protein [Bryobacteraceae bacterium]|jgi:alkylation response protein AidB-like acyl-CoA dehydrogenase|nr:acyl-CoA dehydrogenase family protein [Bryobacteraceae bacterium]
MYFGLSETQQTIKNSAREFFTVECPMAEVRRLMESETACDDALWKKFAEQGWTGIVFPETYDGFGLGLVDMAVAMEEMGRALIPGPFISTVLVAGTIIEKTGSEEQKKKYLGAICRGEAKSTLALLEKSASWDPEAVRIEAKKTDGGYTLSGEKLFVSDAKGANFILVAARVDGELAILLVPADAKGVGVTLMPGIDLTRRLYSISFENVFVPGENLLARGAAAKAAIEAAHDVACVGLTAEMVGGMQRLLDLTVEYAKTRKQFGKPIGTFQAVQHQCADMLFLLEGARSAAYYAAWALEENQPDARSAVSVAKAYASEGYRDAGNHAIQVQGGMGFTWENDSHLYYRRAKGSETAFGDATFHRERIAKVLIDSK